MTALRILGWYLWASCMVTAGFALAALLVCAVAAGAFALLGEEWP